ncbi:hypothetical protein B0O99DRAFT_619738 [Bisporella sp. PMI_857]|nr:hypothetical protein B0O99DRAFT_619738 [Bisporella sp. PMI_857]
MATHFPRLLHLVAIWLLATVSATQAHTWAEYLTRITPDGSFTGTLGFARGHVPRSGNPDEVMVYRITNDNPANPICGPNQQIGAQKPGFPVLEASRGETVAMAYLENGHVSKLEPNRPALSGFVYVYGTSQPSKNDAIGAIHRKWTADGTGGDGRGRLLATRPYDDGQCYERNAGNAIASEREKKIPTVEPFGGVPCQTDFVIPEDAPEEYTVYWVWDWPLVLPDGKQTSTEIYTQCIDIKVSQSQANTNVKAVSDLTKTGVSKAPPAQLAKQFLVDPELPPQPSGIAVPVPPQPKTDGAKAPKNPTSSEDTKPTATSSSKDSKPTAPKASGFITVTVTEKPAVVTIISTETVYRGASSTATGTPPSPSTANAKPDVGSTAILPIPPRKSSPPAEPTNAVRYKIRQVHTMGRLYH